jgi:hypothetical protein
MAIDPGQYDFSLQRRVDHAITLQFNEQLKAASTPAASQDRLTAVVLASAYRHARRP